MWWLHMDMTATLAAYGAQVRQNTAPDGTGATFEADGPVVQRLARAESLMIAEVAAVTRALNCPALPADVRLETVTGAEGVSRLIDVHQRVFRRDESELRESLLVQQDSAREIADLVVAMAGDEPVSSARIEYLPGTDFAGLWVGARCRSGGGAASTARSSVTAHSSQQAAARRT
jgi:hypothetical protein